MSQTTPPASRAAHLTVAVYCRRCQHSAPLDFIGMAETGQPDTQLLRLPLRCSTCGAVAHVQPINLIRSE